MEQCQRLAELQPEHITATVASPNSEPSSTAGSPAGSASRPQRAQFIDTLAPTIEQSDPAGFATYAVEVLNSEDRGAGLSNQVQAPMAPTLAPPGDLKATVTAQGVKLSWSSALQESPVPGLRYRFRVSRSVEGTKPEAFVADLQPPAQGTATLLDRNIQWGATYNYAVSVVTVVSAAGQRDVEVEGKDSPAMRITPADVFPPAIPSGLQAVFSGVGQSPFIDLTWNPNMDPDLAGYNVYRWAEGSAPERINTELVLISSFRDASVSSGHTYSYAVAAVDVRGNESARSQPASESVP